MYMDPDCQWHIRLVCTQARTLTCARHICTLDARTTQVAAWSRAQAIPTRPGRCMIMHRCGCVVWMKGFSMCTCGQVYQRAHKHTCSLATLPCKMRGSATMPSLARLPTVSLPLDTQTKVCHPLWYTSAVPTFAVYYRTCRYTLHSCGTWGHVHN